MFEENKHVIISATYNIVITVITYWTLRLVCVHTNVFWLETVIHKRSISSYYDYLRFFTVLLALGCYDDELGRQF